MDPEYFTGYLHEVSAQEDGATRVIFSDGESALTRSEHVVATALTAISSHMKVHIAYNASKIVFLGVRAG